MRMYVCIHACTYYRMDIYMHVHANVYMHEILYIHILYPNRSRVHINAWAQIKAGVQHSKVNRRLYKMRKGLI